MEFGKYFVFIYIVDFFFFKKKNMDGRIQNCIFLFRSGVYI